MCGVPGKELELFEVIVYISGRKWGNIQGRRRKIGNDILNIMKKRSNICP